MQKRNFYALFISAVLVLVMSLGFFMFSGDDPTTAASFSSFHSVGPTTYDIYTGTWTQGLAIPSPGSNGGAGVGYSRNDTCWLYALNGDIDGSSTAPGTFRLYNITTNTWTTLTSAPSGRCWTSMYKAGPVSNTILYDFGGLPTGATAWTQMTGSLFSYSINLGTWTTLATAPTPAGNAGVWSYQDSILYAIGGVGTAAACLNTVQMYNINSNTWRTCTSLPGTRANGWCFIKNDTIYYGCGCTTAGSAWTNSIYVGAISQTDRSVITWTTSSVTYPGANNEFMDAAPFADGFIIGPGGSSVWWGNGTECYRWNGGTSAFVSVGPLPVATSDAMLGSASFQRGSYKIWKFVVASGELGSAPYHILNTQIFTDSVLSASPPAVVNRSLLLPTPGVNTNYVSVPYNAGQNFGNNITIEAWVKIGGSTTANTILNKGGASFDYQLGIIASTTTPFFRGPSAQATSTYSIPVGVWTHIAVTSDGTTAVFYMNGVPQTIASPVALGSTTKEMRIGRGNADAGSGKLDEIRVWSIVRTPAQILSNMCVKYLPLNSTGLKAIWHMDSTFVDSVSGWNGTAVGTVGFDTASNCMVTSIGNLQNELPKCYYLSQNYPNPFNPVTKISYEIPKSGLVTLKVYDILGKEIATLVNEVKNPGSFVVDFNGSSLSSGIYFYRLESNGFVSTKKMMLIK